MLLTEGGRIRLGWRISLFLLLTTMGVAAVSLVVPPALPYGRVPLLVGSLVGGWALLALDGRGPGALGFYLDFEVVKEAALAVDKRALHS